MLVITGITTSIENKEYLITTDQAIDSPESIISRFRKTAAAPYKSVATPIPDNIQFNSEVPCARSNVKLEYKEDRGRFLVASEDIKPGNY